MWPYKVTARSKEHKEVKLFLRRIIDEESALYMMYPPQKPVVVTRDFLEKILRTGSID
jgi:hypothetical protein